MKRSGSLLIFSGKILPTSCAILVQKSEIQGHSQKLWIFLTFNTYRRDLVISFIKYKVHYMEYFILRHLFNTINIILMKCQIFVKVAGRTYRVQNLVFRWSSAILHIICYGHKYINSCPYMHKTPGKKNCPSEPKLPYSNVFVWPAVQNPQIFHLK